MKIAAALLAAALFASGAASADVVSEHPDAVAVTLYHDGEVATTDLMHPSDWMRDQGLAFITEKRTIDLPAGPAIVKFRGVASSMVPQTATIEGLPSGVLEQNFDYDLLTPGSFLAKSIGETVRLVRTDSKTGKLKEESAIIRSGPDGAMFEVDGKLEALRCSGLPEKLVFNHLPNGLTDTPTLSVRTLAPVAGQYTISLSYIATGLNWSADYVARVEPSSDRLALTGWLTLANFGTTSFLNAPVAVVAGQLETTGQDTQMHPAQVILAANCWPTKINWATYPPLPPPAPPPPAPMESVVVTAERKQQSVQNVPIAVQASTSIESRQFGDYKLYPLPEPTTLAAQQTKQVQFLDQPNVAFERIYRYSVDWNSRRPDAVAQASIILRLQNRTDAGLGKPLPAGGVSVFDTGPEDTTVFAGRDSVRDMAVSLPVEVETGRALDVRITPRLAKSETAGKGASRKTTDMWEIEIDNGKPIPIAFELRQELYEGQATIGAESLPHVDEYGNAVWRPRLTPGERTVLRYTITHP